MQPNNFFDQCANMLWSTKSLKKPSSIDFVLICIGKGAECGTSSSILWGVIVARDTSSSLMFFQISCPSPCPICFTRHDKGLRHRLFFCPLGKSPLPPFVTQFMHLLFWVLSLGWTSTLVVPSFPLLQCLHFHLLSLAGFHHLEASLENVKVPKWVLLVHPRRHLLTYIEHNASKQVLAAGNSSGAAAKGAFIQALNTSSSTQHFFITSLLQLVQQVHNKSM